MTRYRNILKSIKAGACAIGTLVACLSYGPVMAQEQEQEQQRLGIEPSIHFTRLGLEQGLNSQRITAVERDSRGFLWIASFGGLYRYDGYRFRQFKHDPDNPNSLSGDRLRSLTIDRYDRIWVGTESNGVSMYDPSTGEFHRFGESPQDTDSYFAGQTLIIKELGDGSMAFLVFGDGMVVLSADLQTYKKYQMDMANPASISSNHCLAADVDKAGDLWVACFGGTVQKFSKSVGTFTRLIDERSLEDRPELGRVSVLEYMKDGTLWLGTDGAGVLTLKPGSNRLDYYTAEKHGLTADFITKIEESETGEIWIGYRDTGADLVSPDFSSVRPVRHQPNGTGSLSSNNTFGIYQDDEGLMWVPTYGAGLNVANLRNNNMQLYEGTPNAPGPFASNANIWLLEELADGRFLIASRDNHPSIFHRRGARLELEQVLDLEPGDDRPFWLVKAMQASDGTLWLPTVGRGLYAYDLVANKSDFIEGTEGWNIVGIYEDSGGTVWLSEFSRGLFAIPKGQSDLVPFGEIAPGAVAVGFGLVQDMIESGDKSLWFGSRAGLFRYVADRKELKRISSVSSETGVDRLQNSHGVEIDNAGRLWVVGSQIAFTREPFASDPEFIFPFDGTPYRAAAATNVAEDARGRLWFTVQNGLLGYDPASGATVMLRENMGAPIGVPEQGAFRISDGTVAIASNKRLTFIHADLFEQTATVKAPEITRLIVGGVAREGIFSHTARTSKPDVIVASDAQDFTIEYASLTPIASQGYRYQHKLDGFNRDWIETDITRRSATYTNLPPGTYTFSMRAFDANGRSSQQPSHLIIEVQPAFYQTLWFQILAFTAIAVALGLAYRARIAVLAANQRKLEEQVQERTAKIESQRSELAERNRKIEQTMTELQETQSKLIQSEKLAALGGVVAGVAHEVNTPIGLVVSGASQIGDELERVERKFKDAKITKNDLSQFFALAGDLVRLTLRNAQKAAELIKSFKRISADQTSQQVARVNVVEYLRDVVTSMKPMLLDTELRVHVSGDDNLSFYSNPGTISQVITNLVSNSVEHAYDGPKRGTISIAAHRDGPDIVLSVRDDGKGIRPELQSKVFEPFYTTSRGKGNTGLGLHIVHNMVVGGLKGAIELAEGSEHGAHFVIRLPDMEPN